MNLTEEQVKALEEAKALGEEIQKVVDESLAIRSVGGYHIGNLTRKLNQKLAQLEEVQAGD